MNELLGIRKDEDIISKEFATEEEVLRHHDEGVGDPALNPMHPYFLKGGFNTWNDRLCEKFAGYYEQKLGIPLTEAQKMDVELHFTQRINRLSRLWRKAKMKSEAEKVAEERKVQKRSRANTRRLTVSVLPCGLKTFELIALQLYDDRREIAAGNMTNRDGTVHVGWQTLYQMLEKMQSVGMSSDESEAEGNRTVYIIKRRAWRSEEVHRLLLFIDNDRNATSSIGCARPGNPPRERRRLTNKQTTTSKRDPSLGCPINYYDKVYHANLNNRQIRALNAQPEQIFPGIIHTSA